MVIHVSEFGSHCLEANDAWENYLLKNNICNPINEQWKLRDMVTTYREENGTTFIEKRDFTEEEQERYNQLSSEINKFLSNKEIWVGNYLFKNFGYDDLIKFAQTHLTDKTAFQKWLGQQIPCEGITGQCDMLACPVFNNCPKTQGINSKEI